MSDPFSLGYSAYPYDSMRSLPRTEAAHIHRRDPLQESIRQIGRNELRVWFEPDWHLARILARRFRHCLICSIPEESAAPLPMRDPTWRALQIRRARPRLF